MSGTLALVGGGEWSEGCTFDADLLERAGTGRVVVVPTAAAYEQPLVDIARARSWFAGLGAEVDVLDVFRRSEALAPDASSIFDEASFVYIGGGSPMHLRSVLKDTVLWDAIAGVHGAGGLLVADAEAATVVTDPMTDQRGGAFTIGLGLVSPLAVLPRHETWSPERSRRTRELAPTGICVANLDSGSCLVGDETGWRQLGTATASVYLDGHQVGLERLPPLS